MIMSKDEKKKLGVSLIIPNLLNNPRNNGDIPMYINVVPIIGRLALKKRIPSNDSITRNTIDATIAIISSIPFSFSYFFVTKKS